MIIVRTPFRASFFGGGTDYPGWFREHGGAVLSATLDRYCYISARRMPPFLGGKYAVCWPKMERVNEIAELEHAGVRGCLQFLGWDEPIEVNHAGDLPARSGLGSSSAFTVGMLHALHALRGEKRHQGELANEAVQVEQDVLKETVGIQDQIACAFGGLNLITIDQDCAYRVDPLRIPPWVRHDLEARLILVFTGLQRHASEIAAAQVSNAHRREAELSAIARLVPRAVEALNVGDLDEFGHMLDETWELKRLLSDKVTTPEIDALYRKAKDAGALGGKLLGAGGGGFMLLYAREDKADAVRESLGGLYEVPVRFENHGSQIVFQDEAR